MLHSHFGPWVSSLDYDPRADLLGIWKKRLLLLPHAAKCGGRASSAAWGATAAAAVVVVLFPLVRFAPAPAAAPPTANATAEPAAGDIAPATGQAIRVDLPGGAVAEIVGIGHHPSQGQPWWAPDGHPTDIPYHAFAGNVRPGEKEFVREIAVRWIARPGDVVAYWNVINGGSSAGGQPRDAQGMDVADMQALAQAFPTTAKTCDFRFTVGVGPWETIATTDGRHNFSTGTAKYTAAFAKAAMHSEELSLSVAHNEIQQDVRVVAAGHDGQLIPASSLSSGGGRAFLQTTAVFRQLNLEDVKEFRLETRPYQYVEVRNVSLVENDITRPEVVVLEQKPAN